MGSSSGLGCKYQFTCPYLWSVGNFRTTTMSYYSVPYPACLSRDMAHCRCSANCFWAERYKNGSNSSGDLGQVPSPLCICFLLPGWTQGIPNTSQGYLPEPTPPTPALFWKWFVDIALPSKESRAVPTSGLGRASPVCQRKIVPCKGVSRGVRSSLKPRCPLPGTVEIKSKIPAVSWP